MFSVLTKRFMNQSVSLQKALSVRSCKFSASGEEPLWKDPFKKALSKGSCEIEFKEINTDWHYVERLMPLRLIPKLPKHQHYPTPSGWSPPKEDTKLPYFVPRRRDHLFPLYLHTRRDRLDSKTMDFTYVELVEMRGVCGDVFACATGLQAFIESEVGHPVAVNVDELKGSIFVKGVDRTLLEKFLYKVGF